MYSPRCSLKSWNKFRKNTPDIQYLLLEPWTHIRLKQWWTECLKILHETSVVPAWPPWNTTPSDKKLWMNPVEQDPGCLFCQYMGEWRLWQVQYSRSSRCVGHQRPRKLKNLFSCTKPEEREWKFIGELVKYMNSGTAGVTWSWAATPMLLLTFNVQDSWKHTRFIDSFKYIQSNNWSQFA